jgi:hypothetical protein
MVSVNVPTGRGWDRRALVRFGDGAICHRVELLSISRFRDPDWRIESAPRRGLLYRKPYRIFLIYYIFVYLLIHLFISTLLASFVQELAWQTAWRSAYGGSAPKSTTSMELTTKRAVIRTGTGKWLRATLHRPPRATRGTSLRQRAIHNLPLSSSLTTPVPHPSLPFPASSYTASCPL